MRQVSAVSAVSAVLPSIAPSGDNGFAALPVTPSGTWRDIVTSCPAIRIVASGVARRRWPPLAGRRVE